MGGRGRRSRREAGAEREGTYRGITPGQTDWEGEPQGSGLGRMTRKDDSKKVLVVTRKRNTDRTEHAPETTGKHCSEG